MDVIPEVHQSEVVSHFLYYQLENWICEIVVELLNEFFECDCLVTKVLHIYLAFSFINQVDSRCGHTCFE